MSSLKCPHCGADVPMSEAWARAAVSALMQAPAVPAIANQARCMACHQAFTEPAGSQRIGWRALWPAAALVFLLLAVAILG